MKAAAVMLLLGAGAAAVGLAISKPKNETIPVSPETPDVDPPWVVDPGDDYGSNIDDWAEVSAGWINQAGEDPQDVAADWWQVQTATQYAIASALTNISAAAYPVAATSSAAESILEWAAIARFNNFHSLAEYLTQTYTLATGVTP